MKILMKNIRYKLPMLQLMLLAGITAFAQDSTGGSTSQTTVTHNTSAVADNTQAMWYMSPWVWVAAGAVVLLLIVLMVRGNNNDSRQEVTRTTKVTTEVKND